MKFEEWLSQQDGVIEVDCGSVTTEAFYHWMRVAYEAGTLTNEGTIQAVNSPVIPDGSQAMLRRWLAFGRGMQNAGSQLPHNLIAETEAMLAAAPQSPGGEPATVPGKWISVSEQMPEVGVKVLCFPAEDEPIHAVFNGQLWLQDVSWSGSEEPIDNVIPVTVTHWMPLPAGPQEVR